MDVQLVRGSTCPLKTLVALARAWCPFTNNKWQHNFCDVIILIATTTTIAFSAMSGNPDSGSLRLHIVRDRAPFNCAPENHARGVWWHTQVWGAYTGVASRRVHLATVLRRTSCPSPRQTPG